MQFFGLKKPSVPVTRLVLLIILVIPQIVMAKTITLSKNWTINTDEETGSCHYQLTYNTSSRTLTYSGELTGKKDIDNCSAIVGIEPYLVSPSLVLIDAPFERNGIATVMQIKHDKLMPSVITYKSRDEDSLDYKLTGNRLTLFTSVWKKTYILQANGKIAAK